MAPMSDASVPESLHAAQVRIDRTLDHDLERAQTRGDRAQAFARWHAAMGDLGELVIGTLADPDPWPSNPDHRTAARARLEAPTIWVCDNWHLSRMVLKSEALGRNACLTCQAPLRLVTPGSEVWAALSADLSATPPIAPDAHAPKART